jgi:hypothetical protein
MSYSGAMTKLHGAVGSHSMVSMVISYAGRAAIPGQGIFLTPISENTLTLTPESEDTLNLTARNESTLTLTPLEELEADE